MSLIGRACFREIQPSEKSNVQPTLDVGPAHHQQRSAGALLLQNQGHFKIQEGVQG
mgnify:FL=1